MPRARKLRTSWLARSAFLGGILVASSRCGIDPGSNSIGCLAMCRPMSALCFNLTGRQIRLTPRETLASDAHRALNS